MFMNLINKKYEMEHTNNFLEKVKFSRAFLSMSYFFMQPKRNLESQKIYFINML